MLTLIAQSVVQPDAVDPTALWGQLFQALTSFRTGATLAGLVLVVHILVTLSKIPSISQHINSAWRPVIAVFLGVLGGVLSAVVSGSNFQAALSLGIPAGIAAAGGSIVLHEAAQSVQMAWAWLTRNKGTGGSGAGTGAALLILLAGSFIGRAARADVAPAPVKQVLPLVAPSDVVTPPPPAPVTPSTFGGCNRPGTFCAGPWVSLNLMAANISKGTLEGSFSPGLGYGITGWPGQWWSVGFALTGNANPATQQAEVGGIFSFANGYLHIGLSKSFIGDHSWRIPLGFSLPLPL